MSTPHILKFPTAPACGNCGDREQQAQLTTGTRRETWFANFRTIPARPAVLGSSAAHVFANCPADEEENDHEDTTDDWYVHGRKLGRSDDPDGGE